MFDYIDMNALEQELILLRRDFHQYPESGWTEFRTTVRIIEELERLGLQVRYGHDIHVKEKMYGMPSEQYLDACWSRAQKECDRQDLLDAMRGGYTGCVAVIEGAMPGPVIGIRVDIDCNDLQETNNLNHVPVAEGFASVHDGLMHACGHDAHIAIGLGAAKILCACRKQLRGKVVLLFQPGEEGLRGAASMTAAGLVDECDRLFGLHVGIKDLPLGTVFAGTSGFLSSTKFDVTFHGEPAHAGMAPEQGKNAMAAAATAVLNMLAIPRHHDGSSRINVGTFRAGTGRNVIPAEAELTVETRGATMDINKYMEKRAQRVCHAAADMYECDCQIRFMGSAGGVACDAALVERVCRVLPQVDGVRSVLADTDFGGAEDITTMMRQVQKHGGQATEMILAMPLKAPHHNSFFDIDEQVIGLGARIFAQLVMTEPDGKIS